MGDSGIARSFDSRSDEELFAIVRDPRSSRESGAALGVLFERYHARVLHSCERILKEGPAAEDAMQEIFLGLLDVDRHYESRGSFGAWLFVLTRNHCLNALRRRRREVDVDPYEAFLHESDEAPDPMEAAVRRDIGERFQEACETQLSPIEQRVIDLRLQWELPVKEINRMLDLDNASGARTHLSTARRKLRLALADYAPTVDKRLGQVERGGEAR